MSSRGRSISGPENARQKPSPPPPAPLDGPVPPPVSPFARYGPHADAMIESAEENRSQSLGVLAIVGGLVFAMVSAVVIGVVVLVLWLMIRQSGIGGDVATADPTDDQHIRDTGSAGPIVQPDPVPGGGRRVGKGPATGDPNARDPSLGPPPGPATVIVPTTMKATVPDVPGDQKCTVTFQGSEPAKTWITGGETKTCTFNPVTCYLVH